MGGFAGIFQRDGATVEPRQVQALEAALRSRGPDGSSTWCHGQIGLAYSRFVTSASRPQPLQPLHRAGLSLVGDIRLDDRRALLQELGENSPSAQIADAELVLRAYERWGSGCVQRLRGDFAFAVWDASRQEVFCARDPFGVKPFFHSLRAERFVFGNTLDVVRLVPGVSRELDELWIADFIVHSFPLDVESSVYRDVRRVAPGQSLLVRRDGVVKETWWTLPVPPLVLYARPQEYVERFEDVFIQAVADRAEETTGVYLSGGLDSGAIAAALAGRLRKNGVALGDVRAFTTGFNVAFDDPEPAVARQTAAALGVPIEVIEAGDCTPLKGSQAAGGVGPEPATFLYRDFTTSVLERTLQSCRVALNGQGGDEVLSPEILLPEMVSRKDWRLVGDAFRAWRVLHRPALGLRELFRHRPPQGAQVPSWVRQDWSERLALAARARVAADLNRRPALPNALARVRLRSPLWPQYFELNDPGFTGVPVEQRWPFVDRRVIDFSLGHPPFPWLQDKYLLRRSVSGCLPEAIWRRPKTPVPREPVISFLSQYPEWLASQWDLTDWVGTWVDMARLLEPGDEAGLPARLRALALGHWLRAKY